MMVAVNYTDRASPDDFIDVTGVPVTRKVVRRTKFRIRNTNACVPLQCEMRKRKCLDTGRIFIKSKHSYLNSF
jgi:hypothetical protein